MTVIQIVKGLQDLGLNQSRIAEACGVKQPTISRWLTGSEPERLHEYKLRKFAIKKGVIDESQELDTIPVVGHAGAGGAILYSEGQGPFGEAPVPPKGARKQVVAVEVRGDSMSPRLSPGDLVYYNDRQEPPTSSLFGRLCVVGLTDGRVLIKILHRGSSPDLYILTSVRGGEPPEIDAPVAWAARVTFIEPK